MSLDLKEPLAVKSILIAAVAATGLTLSGCGSGSSVSQIVDDHYSGLSDEEKASLCELWNSGTESQDNIVELEMSLAPGWDGGDALTDENEQELGNAIAAWYEGNC